MTQLVLHAVVPVGIPEAAGVGAVVVAAAATNKVSQRSGWHVP